MDPGLDLTRRRGRQGGVRGCKIVCVGRVQRQGNLKEELVRHVLARIREMWMDVKDLENADGTTRVC